LKTLERVAKVENISKHHLCFLIGRFSAKCTLALSAKLENKQIEIENGTNNWYLYNIKK
jgi:hypothetical protein